MTKKNKVLTPEEIRKNALHRITDNLKHCPEPTYIYNIGDSVSIGNLENVVIKNILEDGKIYEVDYTSVDNNYGHCIITEHCVGFWVWHDVRPMRNRNDNKIIKNKDLQLNYSQRSIDGIFSLVYHFGVNLDPIYQRGYVWNIEDKVNLIDSIYNNVDVGKFVFSHEDYNEFYLYEVIDGKQRINALCEFYENKFQYNGLYYNDLTHKEQHHFDNYPVSYAEIREASEEQKIRYFVRLNKFGKIMDKEHLSKIEKMIE